MIRTYEKLKAEARDAIAAKDYGKIHESIGRITMAYELGQLSWNQENELLEMLENAVALWWRSDHESN